MVEFAKIAGLLVFSTLKFFFAPSAALMAGYGFSETIAITITGGFLGFLLFYFAGKAIIAWWQKKFKKKQKSLFTKKNRMIIKVKSKYGLWGIALLSPCILSVPVGALLASYYFPKPAQTIVVFFVSIVIWSLLLTSGWSLILE